MPRTRHHARRISWGLAILLLAFFTGCDHAHDVQYGHAESGGYCDVRSQDDVQPDIQLRRGPPLLTAMRINPLG